MIFFSKKVFRFLVLLGMRVHKIMKKVIYEIAR